MKSRSVGACTAPKGRKGQPAPLGLRVSLGRRVLRASLGHRDLRENRDLPALPDLRATLVRRGPLVHKVPRVSLARLALRVQP
jgi:hypothetical protein